MTGRPGTEDAVEGPGLGQVGDLAADAVGVHVADSAGARPASRRAAAMAISVPLPSGSSPPAGIASQPDPAPSTSPWIRAPLQGVFALLEDQDARPLAGNQPSRRRSNGRHAPAGSPFQRDIRSAGHPDEAEGMDLESAPPVIITSAAPGR